MAQRTLGKTRKDMTELTETVISIRKFLDRDDVDGAHERFKAFLTGNGSRFALVACTTLHNHMIELFNVNAVGFAWWNSKVGDGFSYDALTGSLIETYGIRAVTARTSQLGVQRMTDSIRVVLRNNFNYRVYMGCDTLLEKIRVMRHADRSLRFLTFESYEKATVSSLVFGNHRESRWLMSVLVDGRRIIPHIRSLTNVQKYRELLPMVPARVGYCKTENGVRVTRHLTVRSERKDYRV
jgi:hypothetical protein